jgi:hypothetical protein
MIIIDIDDSPRSSYDLLQMISLRLNPSIWLIFNWNWKIIFLNGRYSLNYVLSIALPLKFILQCELSIRCIWSILKIFIIVDLKIGLGEYLLIYIDFVVYVEEFLFWAVASYWLKEMTF